MGLNKDSRTVNAGKNTLSAFINKIAMLLITFVSRKFFIQYIGVEYFGINGLFSNILTLLSMADLGIGTAMNVSLYKPIAENDTRKLSAILNYFRKLYYIIAAGVFFVGMLLLPFLKYIVNMDSNIPYLYVYYVIFVVKNVVSYLFVYKSSIIRADQKNYLVNRVEVYINVIKVIVQFISVIIFKSYMIYILIEVLTVVANNFTISYIADKNYSFIKERSCLKQEEKKNIFSNMSSVFLYKIAWSLLNGTDNILMSIIVGTVYVGLYSNYVAITSNLETFIGLIFSSLTASVGNLVATSSPENRYKTFKTMQMISFWICSFVCVSVFFLTQDFIELWFGKELLLDNLTLIAIVCNLFFSTCMRPVWTFREGTGMYRQIRYIMFVTAVINLILSIVLGKWLGVSGILFATSVSKIVTYFWYEPSILFKNFFKRKPIKYFSEYIKNTILVIICVGVCAIPIHFINKLSILNWVIKAVVCFIIINIIYFVRYYKTEEFANVKEKAYQLLNRSL
jgi:O-antigen/teichoic acid export membrane protein